MGWIWIDDSSASKAGADLTDKPLGDSAAAAENCSTTTVVRSQCKTEEVEPGKFVRKCDKTEEILRHCFGKKIVVFMHWNGYIAYFLWFDVVFFERTLYH